MKQNKLHPLVLKSKLELQKLDEQGIVTWGERKSYQGKLLPISVDPKLRNRALNFMNKLILLLERNGHSLMLNRNRLQIEMYGQLTEFNLRQKFYRKREKVDSDYSRNIFVKSEDLEFKILDYPRKGWIDKKNKNLEDYLINIYEYVENKSKYYYELRTSQKLVQKERERERLLEQEKANLIAIEKAKFEALAKSSQNYKLANEIRDYLNQYELNQQKEGKIDKSQQEYIKWGRQKADEIDPTINFMDY